MRCRAGRVSRADGEQARRAARSRNEDRSVSAPAVSARVYPGGDRSRSAAKMQIGFHRLKFRPVLALRPTQRTSLFLAPPMLCGLFKKYSRLPKAFSAYWSIETM